MASADFVVPDEETESSPSLDDLIAIFPSDEGTNRLNATKLRNLLARIPDDTITEDMLTDELQESLGDLVSAYSTQKPTPKPIATGTAPKKQMMDGYG